MSSYTVGQLVSVEKRTWKGINKLGGIGRITNINYENGYIKTIDVDYTIGRECEKNVDIIYVTPWEAIGRTSRRSHRAGRSSDEGRDAVDVSGDGRLDNHTNGTSQNESRGGRRTEGTRVDMIEEAVEVSTLINRTCQRPSDHSSASLSSRRKFDTSQGPHDVKSSSQGTAYSSCRSVAAATASAVGGTSTTHTPKSTAQRKQSGEAKRGDTQSRSCTLTMSTSSTPSNFSSTSDKVLNEAVTATMSKENKITKSRMTNRSQEGKMEPPIKRDDKKRKIRAQQTHENTVKDTSTVEQSVRAAYTHSDPTNDDESRASMKKNTPSVITLDKMKTETLEEKSNKRNKLENRPDNMEIAVECLPLKVNGIPPDTRGNDNGERRPVLRMQKEGPSFSCKSSRYVDKMNTNRGTSGVPSEDLTAKIESKKKGVVKKKSDTLAAGIRSTGDVVVSDFEGVTPKNHKGSRRTSAEESAGVGLTTSRRQGKKSGQSKPMQNKKPSFKDSDWKSKKGPNEADTGYEFCAVTAEKDVSSIVQQVEPKEVSMDVPEEVPKDKKRMPAPMFSHGRSGKRETLMARVFSDVTTRDEQKMSSVLTTQQRQTMTANRVARAKENSSMRRSTTGRTFFVESEKKDNSNRRQSIQGRRTPLMQIYREMTNRAARFVGDVVGPVGKEEVTSVPPRKLERKHCVVSPEEECDGGDDSDADTKTVDREKIQIETNPDRRQIFNRLLSEMLMMDGMIHIDGILTNLNARSTKSTLNAQLSGAEADKDYRPFTELEVRSYLSQLEEYNRVFVTWDTRTVYQL